MSFEVGAPSNSALATRGLKHLVKTVAASGTPEAISATPKMVRRVSLYGAKAAGLNVAPTPNASIVYLGDSTSQYHPILPYDQTSSGNEQAVFVPKDETIDLAKTYVRVGTNGDGVLVSYVE